MDLAQQIKDVHLDKKAIEDAGGKIDGQLLEEHRKLLIVKVKDLSEKMKVRIRLDRQEAIRIIKKIKSKDEITRGLKKLESDVKKEEEDVNLLENLKIKELQNV